jgi:hypothetical protein
MASRDLRHRPHLLDYTVTAVASSDAGTVMPSAFAVYQRPYLTGHGFVA